MHVIETIAWSGNNVISLFELTFCLPTWIDSTLSHCDLEHHWTIFTKEVDDDQSHVGIVDGGDEWHVDIVDGGGEGHVDVLEDGEECER